MGALGCSEKKPDPAASTVPEIVTTAAPVVTRADPTATVAPTAAPAASEAPKAEANEAVISFDSAKATKGKVDKADRKIHAGLRALQSRCVAPANKKDPGAVGGSLKMTLEIDKEGKVTKVTPKAEGKVPAEIVACIQEHLEKRLKLDTDGAPATLEVGYKFGPKEPGSEDKSGEARPRRQRPINRSE